MATIRKRGKRCHVQIRKAGHPTQAKSLHAVTGGRASRDCSRLKILYRGLGCLLLADLEAHPISKYTKARGCLVGPRSVRPEIGLLRRALHAGIKGWGFALPMGNPVTQVRLPKLPQGRDRRLLLGEQAEVDKALAGSIEVRAIVSPAIETAMRRGERAALEWQHIDLNRRTLHIPHTKRGTPRTTPLSAGLMPLTEGRGPRIVLDLFGSFL